MLQTEVQKRKTILVVDDAEINRDFLRYILEDEYDLDECSSGVEAIEQVNSNLGKYCVVLLDIVMPGMNGLEVLEYWRNRHILEHLPVILISAETSTKLMAKAFSLGATDYVLRPFDSSVVRHRVANTVALYDKQYRLENAVLNQLIDRTRSDRMMVGILSHIVEFRNGESGLHVMHVQNYTEIILREISRHTDKYALSESDISAIVMASALHDIGKIGIPDEILNKPGRFTPEEREIMQRHSAIGAEMISSLAQYSGEPLVEKAKEICRWHHERWDGRGYPDGLVGDDIPISAQAVSLADVYDALTSKRVYKPALSHEKAMQMITGGECGNFNPLIMECLHCCEEEMLNGAFTEDYNSYSERELAHLLSDSSNSHDDTKVLGGLMAQMEMEKAKVSYFADLIEDYSFDFTRHPLCLELSGKTSEAFGLDWRSNVAAQWGAVREVVKPQSRWKIMRALLATSSEKPEFKLNVELKHDGAYSWFTIMGRTLWNSANSRTFTGCVGVLRPAP